MSTIAKPYNKTASEIQMTQGKRKGWDKIKLD